MIKVKNVCVSYEDKKLLKNISFEIKKGQNFSIVGPNGCGKTTLLRAISSTIDFKGEIFLNDRSVKEFTRKELAKEIAMLSQVMNIYFNYTVFDIVMMGRYVYNDSKFSILENKEDIKKVEETLKIVGLYDVKNREIDTLSGGQVQRVFLAKVIAQDPNIILLDEPTNHLDLSYQVELINFLKKWSTENGKTIIGVLHDINLAMLLTDNIILLNNGEIKALGKTSEVLSSKDINEVYKMDIKKYMLNTLKKWEQI